ncbi:bacterio-opsin activator domain-containing protein [Halobacteriaceae archaeon GCM10025711]
MEELIILASIGLRLVGVAYSVVLLYRVRDLRFGFLTVMLSLMALRQILTVQVATAGLEELPGLVVSVFAVLTVYYLSQYVQQEVEVKSAIQAKNDQLRGFRKAIEHAGHAILITERDGTITYANPAVEDVTGYAEEEVLGRNPRLWKSGEHDDAFYEELWDSILSGEVWDGEIINRQKDGDLCWVDMTIAPIEDDGDIERFVAVETDVTERKEREVRIQRQNDRLGILNNTNEVIRDVNKELVEAATREEIERAVCERFASAEPYEFAWISDRNLVNGSLTPRTWAGVDGDELEAIVDTINDADGHGPVGRAIQTREMQLAQDVTRGDGTWQDVATGHGCQAAVAIPLVYKETLYGVLAICARETYAFDEIEQDVLIELGETIAYAINAVESKQALVTDSVTELEFRVANAGNAIIDLSRELDCEVELEWLATTPEGGMLEYLSVTGADPEAVLSFAETSPAVESAQLICRHDDDCMVRFTTDDAAVTTLADYGAYVEALTASGGEGHVTAELPQHADVRAVVEALQAVYPDAELLARRELDRPVQTKQELHAAIEDDLTDRQMEALQTAYVGGFFDWPRQSTGEEIAAVMGISQSTFLQHLRTAHRKLLGALFDGETTYQAGQAPTTSHSTSSRLVDSD